MPGIEFRLHGTVPLQLDLPGPMIQMLVNAHVYGYRGLPSPPSSSSGQLPGAGSFHHLPEQLSRRFGATSVPLGKPRDGGDLVAVRKDYFNDPDAPEGQRRRSRP